MVKSKITKVKVMCKEISISNAFTLNSLSIIEEYENGILSSIIIPTKFDTHNLQSNEKKFITVKYLDGVKCGNVSEYMADISFIEVTNENWLKIKIEPSSFSPGVGNGHFIW